MIQDPGFRSPLPAASALGRKVGREATMRARNERLSLLTPTLLPFLGLTHHEKLRLSEVETTAPARMFEMGVGVSGAREKGGRGEEGLSVCFH